jgi:hypothetical protein
MKMFMPYRLIVVVRGSSPILAHVRFVNHKGCLFYHQHFVARVMKPNGTKLCASPVCEAIDK